MKGYVQSVLRKTATIGLALSLCLTSLSGCMIVGPLMSVGGIVGLAPLQYASTAYTIGEFTYHYAANDQDPTEVIEAKIDSILTGEAFDFPDANPGYDAPAQSTDSMVADTSRPNPAASAITPNMAAEATLSAQARQKRIQTILGQRNLQIQQLELRRMDFLKAQSNDNLTLRRTAMISSPNLFQAAAGETTLR